MKKFTLSIIAMFLLGSLFAQEGTTNRYPFKKATITYKVSGDYVGTRTVYIDDYGAKQADYWEGSYEKRQPGPNERVAFKFHDIYTGKLKYEINDMDFYSMVVSNPIYFFAQNTSDAKAANEAILKGLRYKKTDQVEQVGDEQCEVWIQHIRFVVQIDNYSWFNDKNIEVKYKFGFLKTLQVMGSLGTATIEKIDFDSEVPASVFSDFPDYYLYQYVEDTEDPIFASDEEKQKFKDDLKLKAFIPGRDIDVEKYKKNIQAFSDQFISKPVRFGIDNDNQNIHSTFNIKERTDSTKEELVIIKLRYKQGLEKLYLDDYKRSFNHFTTNELIRFDLDGKKAMYFSGLKGEEDDQEPLSVIAFNDEKYLVQFMIYGKYTKAEMMEMLKQTKILDL